MGHCAVWIRSRHPAKCCESSGVGKRVKKSNPAIEVLLHRRCAGDWKRYGSQLFGSHVLVLLLAAEGNEYLHQERKCDRKGLPHDSPPKVPRRVSVVYSFFTLKDTTL